MSPASPYGPKADAGPPGLAAKLLGFCDELRGEGVAVGTSEILDAFAALEMVRLDLTRRLPRGAGGDDRQVPGRPSRLRAAVRPLLLPRRRGRGGPARRSPSAARARVAAKGKRSARAVSGSTWSELREQIRDAIEAGDEDRLRDLARLAIAAFGRPRAPAWSGSTCSGSAALSGLTAGAQPPTEGGDERPPLDRDQLNRFERHLRRELERDLIERTETLPPSRPLAELDRALPTNPDPGPGRCPSRGLADEAAAGDARPRAARPP